MRRPDYGFFWRRERAGRVAASIAAVVHPRANEALLPTGEWRTLAPLAIIVFARSRASALCDSISNSLDQDA